jgi:hypothetical protein
MPAKRETGRGDLPRGSCSRGSLGKKAAIRVSIPPNRNGGAVAVPPIPGAVQRVLLHRPSDILSRF